MNKELIKGENAMRSQEGMRNTSGSKVSFEQVGQLIHEKKGKDVCAPREVYLWNGVGQSIEGIPTCQPVLACMLTREYKLQEGRYLSILTPLQPQYLNRAKYI